MRDVTSVLHLETDGGYRTDKVIAVDPIGASDCRRRVDRDCETADVRIHQSSRPPRAPSTRRARGLAGPVPGRIIRGGGVSKRWAGRNDLASRRSMTMISLLSNRGDISIELTQGTFLTSFDIRLFVIVFPRA